MTRAALLATAIICLAGAANAAADGAALFTRCAACHLATGEGVPGSFPPLGAQVAHNARTVAGREYMVTVVTHGLAGGIRVNGQPFDGFMPAQSLTNDEAATVMTYLANAIAKAKPPTVPFTAAEVAAIRGRHASATAQDSHALRPNTLAGNAR